jgi:hypothetical protein
MSAQTEAPSNGLLSPAKNQLGIIALLIVLIYASASVVIGFSGKIDPSQKWPLVWFLALFPLIVLGIFGWLVSRHHGKLIVAATAEAFAGEMYLSTLTASQQRRKLYTDMSAFNAGTISEGQSAFSSEALTRATESPSLDRCAVYIVAEDLVLRQLELDRGGVFMRHVTLEGVPFDAAIVNDDSIIAVEVKFLTSPEVKQNVAGALLDKVEYAATRLKRTRPNSTFTFLLAVVSELADEDQNRLKTNLVNKFGVTPVDIDLEFFGFEQLQRNFALLGADE